MIADAARRGAALADFHFALEGRLFDQLVAAGVLAGCEPARARGEWECLALHACVRGLVAAGGFREDTAQAIDALHEAVLTRWAGADAGVAFDERRARLAERHREYGRLAQAGGASAAEGAAARLGAACARHIAGEGASEPLAELVGALAEAIAEGTAEAVSLAR